MKKRHLYFLVLILFMSCNIFGPKESFITLKIQGVVTDKLNGSAISNIGVKLYSKYVPKDTYDPDNYDKVLVEDITDEDGFYYLEHKMNDSCNENNIDLEVIDLNWVYEWETIDSFYDEPHVRCVEGIQVINIQLERRD